VWLGRRKTGGPCFASCHRDPASDKRLMIMDGWMDNSNNPHHDLNRSRDVGDLRATMTFDPTKINIQQANCKHQERMTVCVQVEVCFTYSIKGSASDVYTGTYVCYAGSPFL